MKKDNKVREPKVHTLLFSEPPTTKMRIKMFDTNTSQLKSDRLVEMNTELAKGPTEVHKGPFGMEVTLYTQTQVDQVIDYLKRLKGDIPLYQVGDKVKIKKDKTVDKMLTEKEPLLDLLKTAKAKGTTQEKLIEFLREYKFKFITGDVILDMAENDPKVAQQIKLREKDVERKFQYMVRIIKEAKDPLNDKYDFRLVFGIKIVGDKENLVLVYLWGKWEETLKIPWEKIKANNFKKVEKVYVFPEFMDYSDRKKWRKEHRAKITWDANPDNKEEFQTSKFYQKWTPYVKGY